MKKLTLLLISTFLASCTASNYCQVYKANAENGIISNGKIVFEDSSCIVSYNLWASGGDIGFRIYNKTAKDLIIDMTKSFFVLNGVAYEYYQNRTFTTLISNGKTIASYPYYYYWYSDPSKATEYDMKSNSTSFVEKPLLTIPSRTLINVTEYRIINSPYLNCDLLQFPKMKKVKTLKFDKLNSPFLFYNIISYKSIGDNVRMENNFYVSEITNMPSYEVKKTIYEDECGKKLPVSKLVFKEVAPDKFYNYYNVPRY